jgi:hypothetical protein
MRQPTRQTAQWNVPREVLSTADNLQTMVSEISRFESMGLFVRKTEIKWTFHTLCKNWKIITDGKLLIFKGKNPSCDKQYIKKLYNICFLSNKPPITPALHRDTIKGTSYVFTQDDNVNYQLARIWKRIWPDLNFYPPVLIEMHRKLWKKCQ